MPASGDSIGLVRGFEALGDLAGERPHLVEGHPPAGQACGEILAVDQFHDERERGRRAVCGGQISQP
jgi:hypothetical protein